MVTTTARPAPDSRRVPRHSGTRITVGISAVVASAFATACLSSPPDPAAGSLWGDATVVEELAIGIEYGDEAYMFSTIYGLAVAPDGAIFVADQPPIRVRAYDGAGQFLRAFGREGQGPGEYGAAPGLAVHPRGLLVMRDSRSSRVSLFSLEGEYLDGFTAVPGVRTLMVGDDGGIWVERFEGSVSMVEYSLEGEELDRVSLPPPDRVGRTFYLSAEGTLPAFPVMGASAMSPLGHVVSGRNDVYDIELRTPDGTVHLGRDLQRPAVGAEEQAEWEAFRRTLLDRDPELPPIPDTKPFFREIRVGKDGRIWVWRYVEAQKRDDVEPLIDRPERPLLTWREPWTYDVFEPDGAFLGSVVVPELLRPFAFDGDRIWGALPDEDGVERVVRLRVVPQEQ